MFCARSTSVGFSRYLSATTTHLAPTLRGVGVAVAEVEKNVQVHASPTSTTNLPATGKLVLTTKHFGKLNGKCIPVSLSMCYYLFN